MRQEGSVEEAFQDKNYKGNKHNQNKNTHVFLLCPYCKKIIIIIHTSLGGVQTQNAKSVASWDMKIKSASLNQMRQR